ncbi:uncharacterized protein PRCAT00001407001 [Priceomyces carsonii]|uniref:uncharacterized protein n=1 Tax=Priceomyces carsonii TaxID=28549 RepID=UPI002EDA3A9F|nr:unnamed protein product [Priceomyces carsonii]
MCSSWKSLGVKDVVNQYNLGPQWQTYIFLQDDDVAYEINRRLIEQNNGCISFCYKLDTDIKKT